MIVCDKCQNREYIYATYGGYLGDCGLDICFSIIENVDVYNGKKYVEKTRTKGAKELNKNLDCIYFKPYPPSESGFVKIWKALRKKEKK